MRISMPFKKGQKSFADIRAERAALRQRARAEASKCIEALAHVRDDLAASPELRAQAAIRLLDLASLEAPRRGHPERQAA
jgi:hypothetical protein